MEIIVDYNYMSVGLEMLNVGTDANDKDSVAKKVEEATEMAKHWAAKNAEETNKLN